MGKAPTTIVDDYMDLDLLLLSPRRREIEIILYYVLYYNTTSRHECQNCMTVTQ